MSSNDVYIIEMPGKEPREVTNINFLKVSELVEKAGGKIYLKPIATPVPIPPVDKKFVFSSSTAIPMSKIANIGKTYQWYEVLDIANEIKSKYFAKSALVKNCRVLPIRRRTKRILGRCLYRQNAIELNLLQINELVSSGKYPNGLQQVIYHEFTHVEFPGERHQGPNFRNKEKNNPFRKSRTNRLTCIS